MPEARAWRTKSQLRSSRLLAQSTRAQGAHPKIPNSEKVMRIEVSGETFRGKIARTAIKRKIQGSERNRSVVHKARRSQAPPRNPATPPRQTASRVETRAAAGASSKETRVP